jgi:MOSC domain-containing protein YiiM
VKIRHIFISPGHNFYGHNGRLPGQHPTLAVSEVECVAGKGLVGDRFFNYKANYKGQVTFLSNEVFAAMCAELKVSGKSPGESRRNIVVAEVDLNTLVGQEFTVQGVRFRGMAECSPCHWMDEAFAPGAEKFLQNRGGLRAQILTDGKLRVEPC